MPPAARITDFHACPMVTGVVPHVGGPIAMGSPNVFTGKLPQARVGDRAVCVGPPDVIVRGSAGVFVNKRPAARIGDNTAHGGVIVVGLPSVIIGELGGGGGGGAALDGVSLAYAAVEATIQTLISAASSGAPFCEACFEEALKKSLGESMQPRTPQGVREPEAVPMTPAIEEEIYEGRLREISGPPVEKPGYPTLSPAVAATFRGEPQPVHYPEGTRLRRVVGEGNDMAGAYWVKADEFPASKADWRRNCAVKGEWNGDGSYVEYVVPKAGLNAWTGPARAQQSSDGQAALPGGANQIVIDPKQLDFGDAIVAKPTGW